MNIRLLELKDTINTLNFLFNETNNYSDSSYSDSYYSDSSYSDSYYSDSCREGRDWCYFTLLSTV